MVALYNARSATAIVPAGEAAAYGTAQLPDGDAELSALVKNAVPEQDAGYAEPIEVAVNAISDALDGRALSRDDLHEELRRQTPEALLPWCPGCESHHAILAGLHGRLCISGRVGRQPEFSRTDQLVNWDPPSREEAAREFVTRYKHLYGE